MLHGLSSGWSLSRIELQQLLKEIQQQLVVGAHPLSKGRLLWHQKMQSASSFWTRCSLNFLVELSILCEVLWNVLSAGHHVIRKLADDAQNSSQQTLHRVILEQDIACPELSEDAAQGPQVNLLIVGETQHHLGGSV